MQEAVAIPAGRKVRGAVSPAGSKSYAQRALVLAALADSPSRLVNVPDAGDVEQLLAALGALGVLWERGAAAEIRVRGLGPGWRCEARAAVGNNGTALRFLTALAALRPARTVIEGAAHRPVEPLVAALGALGAEVTVAAGGGAPVAVQGGALRGGQVTLPGSVSSQFASALMLIAPRVAGGIAIELSEDAVSSSYLSLTAALLREFGASARLDLPRSLEVPGPQRLAGRELVVEADASAAAFYLAAAAVTRGEVRVTGVGRSCRQGDARFAGILERMGCGVTIGEDALDLEGRELHAVEVDLGATPDLVPPLAAVAPFAAGVTRVAGIEHLRYKESDRLRVLEKRLGELGVTIRARAGALEIEGARPGALRGAALDPHADHRMAMAFAVIGLCVPGVTIRDPGCVAKSDPRFFARLFRLLDPPPSDP